MEVSYGEGVATHTGPESCAVDREVGGEALTGERAGRVLSREIHEPLQGADAVEVCGRPHWTRRQRETRPGGEETTFDYDAAGRIRLAARGTLADEDAVASTATTLGSGIR